MTDKRDLAMLRALDRFISRYGPNAAVRLAEIIRDRERAEELADALDNAAIGHTTQGRRRDRARTEGVGMKVLRDLRKSDPAKHSIVAEFRRELVSGAILSTLGELRQFAFAHDLSIGKAKSRNAAIPPLLKSLSSLPIPELNALRDSVLDSRLSDTSLIRWREVIVGRELAEAASLDDDLSSDSLGSTD